MKPLRPLLVPCLLLAALFWLVEPRMGSRGADSSSPAPTASPTAAPSAEIAEDVATHAKSADDLWAYIKKWSNTDDLKNLDPSLGREEMQKRAKEIIKEKIAHLHPAITEFIKRYPQEPRRWDVKMMRLFYLKDAENITEDEAMKTFKEIAAAPDASKEIRQQARGELLQAVVSKADPSTGLTDAIEKEIAAYEKDFPDDPDGSQFVDLRMELLKDSAPDKIDAALAALAKSPNKATAEAASRQLALRTQPVDLKFTALDGTAVDLSKLRGKVLLLDFWATWCGPCMAKLPEILAIQKKYKGKDFQLVGISLDQDKAALEKTVKAKGMDWPQYFDGKGWESDVGTRFGVRSIPAAWLVDKKGLVHMADAQADLDTQIDKLLATP